MRLQTILILTFAALSAAVTALAWHQYVALEALRANALAGTDRASYEARIARLIQENQALQAKIAGARAAVDDDSASAASRTAHETETAHAMANAVATLNSNATPETKRQAELDLIAALSDLPEFQKLIAIQQRGAVDGKYAALFRKLQLTPEQQDQFATLLADKQSAFADALAAARDQGLTGKDARLAAKTVAQSSSQQIDASIKSLLGDQAYQQYQNYERTMPQRETVNQLAQRLSYSNAPLTPRQQDQLVQALASGARQDVAAARAQAAATGEKMTRPITTMNGLPNALGALGINGTSGAVITPSGMAKAQTVLSPPQLATLEQLQQQQQAQLNLGKLVRSAARPAPVPAPAPAPLPPKGKG